MLTHACMTRKLLHLHIVRQASTLIRLESMGWHVAAAAAAFSPAHQHAEAQKLKEQHTSFITPLMDV